MTSKTILKTVLFTGLAFCLQIASTQIQLASQQPAPQVGAPAGQGGARGGGQGAAVDPRVQQRTYSFKDTNEELPYAVFVSSKVSKDKKNPLIVALHGLGGNPNTMLRGNALQLAEEGGYILVGPMGYSPGGWYGTPYGQGGRGRGAKPCRRPRLRGAITLRRSEWGTWRSASTRRRRWWNGRHRSG